MSFSTALSGLNAASSDLNVKSNNIANVNTVGFKQSRAEFGDVFAVSAFGSSSKTAIGSGVVLSNVAQQFNQGNLEFTDNSLDLAISGEGFFAMAPTEDSGEIIYTRAGAFGINKDGFMVNSGGNFLRTFPVNENGEISATSMSAAKPLQLPAAQGEPEATTELKIATNLPSNAEPINAGTVAFTGGLATTDPITVTNYDGAPEPAITFAVDGIPINLSIDYTNLEGVAGAIQTQLNVINSGEYIVSENGTSITIIKTAAATAPTTAPVIGSGAGGGNEAEFTTTTDTAGATPLLLGGSATTTGGISSANYSGVNDVTFDVDGIPINLDDDYTDFAGVVSEIQSQLDTSNPGEYVVSDNGIDITITKTALSASPTTLVLIDNGGSVGGGGTPADFTTTATAVGAPAPVPSTIAIDPFDISTYSNSTSATIYDSLGNEHIVTTYYQKVDQAAIAGVDNQWVMAVYVAADDIKNPTSAVGIAPNQLVQLGSTTTIQFSDDGSMTSITPDPIELDLTVVAGTELKSGAADQTITLNLNGSTQNSGTFAVGALTVNGFPTGRLTGVDVSEDGLIRATYSNGQAVAIGKIALANFANVQALNKVGNTAWKETTDSGPVIAGEAATGSFGKIQSGALETSNVDLTKELVGLITAQRNFQANSKSIETFNTITQTIINIR